MSENFSEASYVRTIVVYVVSVFCTSPLPRCYTFSSYRPPNSLNFFSPFFWSTFYNRQVLSSNALCFLAAPLTTFSSPHASLASYFWVLCSISYDKSLQLCDRLRNGSQTLPPLNTKLRRRFFTIPSLGKTLRCLAQAD